MILLFSISSCRLPNDRDSHAPVTDSARLVIALDKSLKIALDNIDKNQYNEEFVSVADSFEVATSLEFGSVFSERRNHLIITRKTPEFTYVDVFVNEGRGFKKALSYEGFWTNYDSTMVQDVNGDNFKDLVIKWHPASGCCMRDCYDVFLCNETGAFSKKYEFMNPTFSADEGTIRGVTYGHPGEASLYKFVWNRLAVDTIEYIYHDSKNKGRYVKSRYDHWDERNSAGKKVTLKAVPEEYRYVKGLDWFLTN